MKNSTILALAVLAVVALIGSSSATFIKPCSVDMAACTAASPTVCARHGKLNKCQLYLNSCTLAQDNCYRFIPFNTAPITYCANFAVGTVAPCVGLTGLFG